MLIRSSETLVADDGRTYHILGYDSDVIFVYDPDEEMEIHERRTNFWDDRAPTTQTILERPLRSFALPGGMYRPYDMHEDTFTEYDHGCAVQMLLKSFTKREKKNTTIEPVFRDKPGGKTAVEQLQDELDACFTEEGYTEGAYPFESGWRNDGCTSQMIIRFCKRQADKGRPVKCSIFHTNQKIAQYAPPDELSGKYTPTVVFAIHGDHAHFYNNGKNAAAQKKNWGNTSELSKSDSTTDLSKPKFDEYTNKRIREPFSQIESYVPPFSEWRDSRELLDDMENGFAKLKAKYEEIFAKSKAKRKAKQEETQPPTKRRRCNDSDQRARDAIAQAIYLYEEDNLYTVLKTALHHQREFQGTANCFGIDQVYGNDPNKLATLNLIIKDLPKVVVETVPKDHGHLQTIAESVGLVYHGESIASFGEQLRLFVLKKGRAIAESTKLKVLESQFKRCAKCKVPLSVIPYEFDHIIPNASGGDNDEQNVQALCKPCHKDKCDEERMTGYKSAFYSELSTDVMEALVDAPTPQQLCFGNGKPFCYELDVVKCRQWAIQKADVPLPIANIMDTIEPFKVQYWTEAGRTIDFVFLDAGEADTPVSSKSDTSNTDTQDTQKYHNWAAYQGPRWYTRELAQYVLDVGVQNAAGETICMQRHFVAMFCAHEHANPSRVAFMYEQMESTVQDALGNSMWTNADIEKMSKKLILAMQGSWLTKHSYSWSCTNTNHRDDVPGQVTKFCSKGASTSGECRYMIRSETLSNRTMFLFGLFSLNREHLLVCKAIRLTEQLGCQVHGVCVDGVFVAGGPKKMLLLRHKVNEIFREKDSTLVYKLKGEEGAVAGVLAKCTAINHAPRVRGDDSHASAWRPEEYTTSSSTIGGDSNDDRDALLWPRFRRSIPQGGAQVLFKSAQTSEDHDDIPDALGNWLHEPRFLYERHWRFISEPEGIGDCSEHDTFQDEVAKLIFENQGGYVSGRGGCGKSQLIEKLKVLFEAAKYRCDMTGFTHVQAANINGVTVLHDLWKNIKCKRRVLIIDEASQLPLHLWSVIATLNYVGCKIVVLGDFEGQLPPIADRTRMDLWKKIPGSPFMHDLCNGLHIKMQKIRRGNPPGTGDFAHYEFTGSIYPPLSSSAADENTTLLHEALVAARARYPRRNDEHDEHPPGATILTITHILRVGLNAKYNKLLAPANAVHVPYLGGDVGAQPMLLWEDMVLQSAVTDKNTKIPLLNGLRYKVCSVSADITQLVQVNDTAEAIKEPFEMATKDVPRKLRLTYAITYDSAQARTLHGGVLLTQTDHQHFTLRRLIVGLGRAPLGSDVQVEYDSRKLTKSRKLTASSKFVNS